MNIRIKDFNPKAPGPMVDFRILKEYRSPHTPHIQHILHIPRIGEWVTIPSLERTVEVIHVEYVLGNGGVNLIVRSVT